MNNGIMQEDLPKVMNDKINDVILIGIAGKKQHGKNTVCNIIKKHFDSVEVCSFANPMRAIGRIFGFTDDEMFINKTIPNKFWGISWRQFAQMLGTDMFRNVYRDDVWIKLGEKSFLDSKCKIVLFDDVRFDNEAKFILGYNGVIINVSRPLLKGETDNHASEKGVSPELITYNIVNDGTMTQLEIKVLEILQSIL